LEEIEKPQEVSWNLSMILIAEIGNLLNHASNNYVKRNYGKAFDYLKAVKMRVVAYLSKDEINKLSDMEDKAYKYIEFSKPKGFNPIGESYYENTFKLWKLLDEYNTFLFSLLRKYGLLIPMKEDTSKLGF